MVVTQSSESEFDDVQTFESDGFNVVGELPVQQFIEYESEGFGEFLHLVPDNEEKELRCYRSIGREGSDNYRVMTTIENVAFSLNFDGERKQKEGVEYWYLTHQKAHSFMLFIETIARRETKGYISVSWWEDSGMEMMEEERTNIETLNLRFETTNEHESKRQMQIMSAWQSPRSHRMAHIEGESL